MGHSNTAQQNPSWPAVAGAQISCATSMMLLQHSLLAWITSYDSAKGVTPPQPKSASVCRPAPPKHPKLRCGHTVTRAQRIIHIPACSSHMAWGDGPTPLLHPIAVRASLALNTDTSAQAAEHFPVPQGPMGTRCPIPASSLGHCSHISHTWR